MGTIKADTFQHENASSGLDMDASGNATLSADLTVDTDTLKVDSTNDRVGINKASPTVALDVTGAITASGTITGNSFSGDGSALTGMSSGVYAPKGSRTFTQSNGRVNGTTTITQSPGSYDAYIEGNIAIHYNVVTIQSSADMRLRLRLKDAWVSVSTQQVQGVQFGSSSTDYNTNRDTWPGAGNYGMTSLAGIPFVHPYYQSTGTFDNPPVALSSRIGYDWNNIFSSETGSLTSVKDETYGYFNQVQSAMLLVTYRGFCASGGTFEFLAENASGIVIGDRGAYTILSYEL